MDRFVDVPLSRRSTTRTRARGNRGRARGSSRGFAGTRGRQGRGRARGRSRGQQGRRLYSDKPISPAALGFRQSSARALNSNTSQSNIGTMTVPASHDPADLRGPPRKFASVSNLKRYTHDSAENSGDSASAAVVVVSQDNGSTRKQQNPLQELSSQMDKARNSLRDYLSANKEALLEEKAQGGGPTTDGLGTIMQKTSGSLLYAVDQLLKHVRLIVNKKNKYTIDEATLVAKSVLLMKKACSKPDKEGETQFTFKGGERSTIDKLLQVLSFALVGVNRTLEEMKEELLSLNSVTLAFQYCEATRKMADILSELDLTSMGEASDAELLADAGLTWDDQESEDALGTTQLVLMANEKKLLSVPNVRLQQYTERGVTLMPGALYLTNYRIIFKASHESSQDTEFPIHLVRTASKFGSRKRGGEDSYGVELDLKDLRTAKLLLNKEAKLRGTPVRRILIQRIKEQLRKPPSRYFAFHHRPSGLKLNGWLIYDAVSEYARIGIPSSGWRLSKANEAYALCQSYPRILAVPSKFSDGELAEVAAFRSRGRIPALSWINKTNHATLTRCSQPKSGVARHTCAEDESLLEAIKRATPGCSRLRIFDARPKANAMANTAKGAGFEVMGKYKNFSTLSFLGIGNIHVMRDSANKLMDLQRRVDDDKYLTLLSETQWLHHCKLILSNVGRIVETLTRFGEPVLIHCSDGWDRTAQLCSIAMLEMDAYFRTMVGFEVLIEKEWLSFGHQFALRCGHDARDDKDDQRSPIFFQFMFTVYQIMCQFPFAFEFNEEYLLALMHHLYSCLYGTFLFNTEKARHENAVQTKTTSLWSYLNAQPDFKNPFYKPSDQVLVPKATVKALSVWERYFARNKASDLTTILAMELVNKNAKIRELEEKLAKVSRG